MPSLEKYRKLGEELEEAIRLVTYPVALKLLEPGDAAPEDARKPLQELGSHISLCQAIALSRREGARLIMEKEDMWCIYPIIALGLAEPPPYFFEGHTASANFRDPQSMKNWARAFPRFETGKYSGIVIAPLKSVDFEPDIVLVYCNSIQMNILIQASIYESGIESTIQLGTNAACGYYLVPTVKTGQCQIAIPCGGDRRRAIARDDEIIFAAPKAKLDELQSGLSGLINSGKGFPRRSGMELEYDMPSSYREVARQMGMDIK